MEKIINETTENTVEIVNIDVDVQAFNKSLGNGIKSCLLYTSPSPRDQA